MTSKNDTSSRRFWNLLEKFKKHYDVTADDPDLNASELSTKLSMSISPGNPADDAIAYAFDSSGLNIRNPTRWKLLMSVFCIAFFAKWPKRGAHRIWTSAQLGKLYLHVAEIQSRRSDVSDPLSDSAVAAVLRKNKPYKETYGSFTLDYLRERIRDARNSKQEFDRLLQNHLASMRPVYESANINWTPEMVEKLAESFADTARRISDKGGAH